MSINKHISILLTLSFILFAGKIDAQTKLSFTDIDKLTYQFYTKQKWDDLIKTGKEAIDNNIDFYYLNYRMGVAYYSKKRYRKAISFFEEVVNAKPNDATAKEYLYYSYLLGSRTADATKMLYSLEVSHRKKIEFHNTNSIFNGLGFEYKYYSFGNYTINESVNTEIVQKTRKSLNYLSADLLNYSQNNSTIYFNTSIINGDNYVYNNKYSPLVIDEDLRQIQLYFSWNKLISDGLSVKIAMSYMHENLKWYDYQSSSNNSGILVYDGSTNNFVGFASFTKSTNNIDFYIGSSISRINDEKQTQPFVGVKWFPFSNKGFYTNTSIVYQYNFNSYNDNFVFKHSFITELNSKLSLKAYGLYGKIYNLVDNDGLSIYNNLDAIDYWYGLSVNYYLSTTTQMYLSYRNDGQTNNYTENIIDKEVKYDVNSVLIGLRFNF